jgi:hypothetical protein
MYYTTILDDSMTIEEVLEAIGVGDDEHTAYLTDDDICRERTYHGHRPVRRAYRGRREEAI